MNKMISVSQNTIEHEVPRLMIAEEALFSMVYSSQLLSRIFEIQDPSEIDQLKHLESMLKNELFRFDMFLNALTWGTQSKAFEGVSGGLIKNQWIQSGLGEQYVIQKPKPIQAQLAGEVAIYSNAFAEQSLLAVNDHKYYLDVLVSEDLNLIAAAEEKNKTHLVELNVFFESTLKDLDKLVQFSNQETERSIESIERFQNQLLLFIAFVILVSFIFALFLSRTFTQKIIETPLSKLLAAVQKITQGDLSKRTEILSEDEIGQLARAFNQMTDALQESYVSLEGKVRQRTKELASEKRKLESTLESIGDGAFTLNQKGEILFFNRMAEKLTGFSKRSALKKPYKNILKFIAQSTGKQSYGSIETALKKGKVAYMKNHHLLISKTGKAIPITNSAAPIKDQNGKLIGCVVIFRDMTHEYEVDKMKTEFISLASHQLRTPLTTVNWFSEILLDEEFGKLNKKQREFILESQSAIVRMTELVNGLINISKISAGKLVVSSATVQLKEVVEKLSKQMRPIARKKHQKLIFEIDSSLSSFKTDPKLLHEVVVNLISNAIKYSDEKKTVIVKISKKKNKIFFEVIDEGFGIPKDQQKYIFTKFFRADNAGQSGNEGSGLGLYLVQKLVEAMHGKISFKSSAKGTTFFVSLPFKE